MQTKRLTKKQECEANKADAIDALRKLLPPGTTVFTTVRHVSRSGMFRRITCCIVDEGRVLNIDWLVQRALGYKRSDKPGVAIGGCGMDMGFALVYDLSSALYPNGHECIGERCPSNDHSNSDRKRTPHHHRDGGYALRKEWI